MIAGEILPIVAVNLVLPLFSRDMIFIYAKRVDLLYNS